MEKAQQIPDPWYRAQALSWVVRFTDSDPRRIARQAAKAATECKDDFKRSSIRAWELAALAQRGLLPEARTVLTEAVRLAASAQPVASRSEALLLLMQAAFSIDSAAVATVRAQLETSCSLNTHWQIQRNLRDAARLMDGALPPRLFFW